MFKVILLVSLATLAKGAEEPQQQQNQDADSTTTTDRSNEKFYLQQLAYPKFLPNLQRLDLSYEPNPTLAFNNPAHQQQQESTPNSKKISEQASSKIENLDSDVELVPEAQSQNVRPNTQVPTLPQGGYSGLLPGQRFYIINPQQQFYNQNPVYTQYPNDFLRGGQPQIPDYQRFFLVPQGVGAAGGPNLQAQAGIQNAAFFDPTLQGYGGPSLFQQQQIPRNNDLNQSKAVQDAQDDQADINNINSLRGSGLRQFQYPSQPQFLLQQQRINPQLLQAANLGLLSPGDQFQPQIVQGAFERGTNQGLANAGPQYFPRQDQGQESPIRGQFDKETEERFNQIRGPGGAYTPVFAGAPPAALPFFGIGRQFELPLGQQQQQPLQHQQQLQQQPQQYQPQSPYSQLLQFGRGNNGIPVPVLGGYNNGLLFPRTTSLSGKGEDISTASSNNKTANESPDRSVEDKETKSRKEDKSSQENTSAESSTTEVSSTEKNN